MDRPALGGCRSRPGYGCSPLNGTPWPGYLRERNTQAFNTAYIYCIFIETVSREECRLAALPLYVLPPLFARLMRLFVCLVVC